MTLSQKLTLLVQEEDSLEQSTFVMAKTYSPKAINKGLAPKNSAIRALRQRKTAVDCFTDSNRRCVPDGAGRVRSSRLELQTLTQALE